MVRERRRRTAREENTEKEKGWYDKKAKEKE